MTRRKILDEADAWACLAAVEAAGLSRGEWARANGVDGRSLHCWWLALRGREAEAPPPMRMVELIAAPTSESALLVRAGRCEVEVAPGFDEETLLRMLRLSL